MSLALPTLVCSPLPDKAQIEAEGGFSWWYVDLVDEHGSGLVVIVALGLPFLPGYASSARAGTAPPARSRPSICVSALREGKPSFYALHEIDPKSVQWSADRVRMGDSELSVAIEGGRVSCEARLSGVLPGCPWSLSLSVRGPLRRPDPSEPERAEHEWSVLTAVAEGRATLEAASMRTEISGRAYLDRNAGDRSLEGFDLERWSWGRLAFPGRERIWYLARDTKGQESSLSLEIGADGATQLRRGCVRGSGSRLGRWGLPSPRALVDGDLEISPGILIDDSPFYSRFLCSYEGALGRARGFSESCMPSRIDRAWFRPLLRMAVCHEGSANSMWLPLFSGPSEGRLSRLIEAGP